MNTSLQTLTLGLCLAAAGLSPTLATAQSAAPAPTLTRTLVTKGDVSVPGREGVVMKVELPAGAVAGWHTHPGEEISYVLEGETVLLVAGQAPRKVVAGEGFVIPAGVVHSARNESPAAAKLVGVYVVEKGQPLASPAAAPASP
ncbi:cupin domain-containing protein [Roseateles koreensis]|uniref:Cupin domain-containing protein n=1 Tax=Roseateles koreensis TaxID=2987526 RepID=A0ABT5KR06_9BURK|nr:cupin domain-containing protein [Roseateles koreensis]MDC8784895.1 cupin domain-containing protein [Roseateles koreensis]